MEDGRELSLSDFIAETPKPPEPKPEKPRKPQPGDRFRQLRGLLIWFGREPERTSYRRNLIRRYLPQRLGDGFCVWCERPADTPRKRWHEPCVEAYQLAKGYQNLGRSVLPSPRECAVCGGSGDELDHRDALVDAFESGDPRRLLRAYTASNLQWLCREHHLEKTAAEATARAARRRPQEPEVESNQLSLLQSGPLLPEGTPDSNGPRS